MADNKTPAERSENMPRIRSTNTKPMNITWHLDRPIPAKFLKKTNKLVVG